MKNAIKTVSVILAALMCLCSCAGNAAVTTDAETDAVSETEEQTSEALTDETTEEATDAATDETTEEATTEEATTEEVTEAATDETTTAAETEKEQTGPVKTFRNPLNEEGMADPFITYYDGYYYGMATEMWQVRLHRSKEVEKLFTEGEYKDVFICGDEISEGVNSGANLWAPEIHFNPATQKWYIYFCASIYGFEIGDKMRMFCLESDGTDPFGEYTFKGMTLDDGVSSIDQTVYYDEESGELYTAYSVIGTDKGQVIMIADMENPWTVGKTRNLITYAKYMWEKHGTDGVNDGRVNEGPIFLKHDGKIFLIYSGSGCWTEYYSLGMLLYKGPDTTKENFLNPDNWEKSKEPIFKKGNDVYGVGHCNFFYSPDGTELWMAYHGMFTRDGGMNYRYPYIQRVYFDENGMPDFGKPLPRQTDIPVPSGQ